MKTSKHLCLYIGVLFLFFQLVSIIHSRFIPERFFCWAPYDEHSYYEIKVNIDGRNLTNNEVRLRYRYSPKGWEPRSMDNIFSLVKQYENTRGAHDNASVVIEYKTNGHEELQWRP